MAKKEEYVEYRIKVDGKIVEDWEGKLPIKIFNNMCINIRKDKPEAQIDVYRVVDGVEEDTKIMRFSQMNDAVILPDNGRYHEVDDSGYYELAHRGSEPICVTIDDMKDN